MRKGKLKFTQSLKTVKTAKLPQRIYDENKNQPHLTSAEWEYFVSVLGRNRISEMPHKNKSIGLDLGIKDLCITSDGKKYENPKTTRKYVEKAGKITKTVSP